ncbi:hypothetical protein GCM10025858_12390 [Alicyclobacillus sacchari]|nr:hypothetical protein GCM10025858_12390 [Alicyclobacillus sacchari]
MAIAVSQAGPVAAPKRHSQFYLGWKRFSKNYFAVAGLVWVAIFFIVGIIGPWIAPYSYKDADFLAMHTGPSWKHLFGTDTVGYDVFSQILFSIRYALEIALGATCVSFVIGVILGLWAGLAWHRGRHHHARRRFHVCAAVILLCADPGRLAGQRSWADDVSHWCPWLGWVRSIDTVAGLEHAQR